MLLLPWMGLYLLCLLFTLPAWSEPMIRVAVEEAASKVSVTGQEMSLTSRGGQGDTKPKRTLPGRSVLHFSVQEKLVRWEGGEAEELTLTSAKGKTLQVGEKHFPGFLQLRVNDRKLVVINHLPLERYLEGVVSHELPTSWPLEILKAQAVLSRTFALQRMQQNKQRPYDLKATILDQVYGGHTTATSVRQAVADTQGLVLVHRGSPIEAFFHSCCGGKTELPQNVWRNELPYYTSVICPYCAEAPDFFWEYRLSRTELLSRLRPSFPELRRLYDLSIAERTPANRNRTIKVKAHFKHQLMIPGDQFRALLGYFNLKSTWFKVFHTEEEIQFLGSGSGHGVGLCQWGGRAMAELGKDFRQILAFYFPGVSVSVVAR